MYLCIPHICLLLLFWSFICFWSCWVFIAVRLFSSCGAWGSHRSGLCCGAVSIERRADFSGCGACAQYVASRLWSTGAIVGAHGRSCSMACGIFLDQRSNPCLLHRQVDSFPLNHQGNFFLSYFIT